MTDLVQVSELKLVTDEEKKQPLPAKACLQRLSLGWMLSFGLPILLLMVLQCVLLVVFNFPLVDLYDADLIRLRIVVSLAIPILACFGALVFSLSPKATSSWEAGSGIHKRGLFLRLMAVQEIIGLVALILAYMTVDWDADPKLMMVQLILPSLVSLWPILGGIALWIAMMIYSHHLLSAMGMKRLSTRLIWGMLAFPFFAYLTYWGMLGLIYESIYPLSVVIAFTTLVGLITMAALALLIQVQVRLVRMWAEDDFHWDLPGNE